MNWIKRKTDNWNRRLYFGLLALTALGAYGYEIMHTGIGVDDTCYDLYFEDGMSVVVGRWVMYLLNKVVHMAEYAPYFTEFASVLIFMAAVTVWALLFREVLGEAVPKWGYYFFSCVFLSCPLVSEVFTYYLHNGVATGYLLSGISLWLLRSGWLRLEAGEKRRGWESLAGSLGILVAAIGCYESFMIVWLVGVLLLLLAERMNGNRCVILRRLLVAALIMAVSVVLRSVIVAVLTAIYDLEAMESVAPQRSVTEMLEWIFDAELRADFRMALKRTYILYGVFACAYYPIRIFVFSVIVMGLYGLWKAVRRRDLWIPVLFAGAILSCFLLTVLEGSATLYRSAQFLPLICGTGALMFAWAVRGIAERLEHAGKAAYAGRILRGAAVLILAVILWNQCEDMNRWFYIDYKKYEYSVALVREMAYELEKSYDTSKPIYFVGGGEMPQSIIQDAYVEIGSGTYYRMKWLADLVDEHLLEKYYTDYGVQVAQTPTMSVIEWSKNSFGGGEELVKFFAMHGYSIVSWTDEDQYFTIDCETVDMPCFPEEGSIVDCGDYIIVKL